MKIAIDYLDGSLTSEDLDEIKTILESEEIELLIHCQEPQNIDGIDDMFPNILLFMNQDILQAFILGLATNGLYDVIKKTILSVHTKLSSKKINRIQNRKIEQVTPKVNLRIGKANMILPMNLPKDRFEYCIDKFFESVKEENMEYFTTESIATFDAESRLIKYFSQHEYIRTYAENKISSKKG